MNPFVIAICGIDGSGKSTQVNLLTEYLRECGFATKKSKVNTIGTKVLMDLAEKMFGDRYDYYPGIPPEIMHSVRATDFARHYLEMYKANEGYDFIICDRHKLCCRANSMSYKADMKWIDEILSLIPDPDLIIFLNVSIDIAVERMIGRINEPMQVDENPELLAEAIKCYEVLFATEKLSKDVVFIDGNMETAHVHSAIVNKIVDKVNARIPNKTFKCQIGD